MRSFSLASALATEPPVQRVEQAISAGNLDHALELAAQVWGAHGANLLGFVPETVAQLAELLDDADPRAAASALRLRRAIEAALGEPLDSYLA